jgi:hypothetical protein
MPLMIVGFNGCPVKAGAGIRPVLVFDPELEKYSVVQGSFFGSWVDKSEAILNESRCTLIGDGFLPYYPEQNIVALYAHSEFIKPSYIGDPSVLELVHLPISGMYFHEKSSSHFCFSTKGKALEILDSWSDLLLASAQKILQSQSLSSQLCGQMAFRESMRSHFALESFGKSLPNPKKIQTLLISWMSLLLQDRTTKTLELTAITDFGEKETRKIEQEAKEKVNRLRWL